MAFNPDEYIAEFLAHHGKISDSIFLIDHRSDKNLSELKFDNVTHIESNQVRQFQSEVTNTVIRDYRIYENFDWIFVLDIDEFLPFNSKQEINEFLWKYKDSKTVAFNWMNGVGVYPTIEGLASKNSKTLIDVTPHLISKVKNPTFKVCVNCKKTKYPFYFGTGAHYVTKINKIKTFLFMKNKYKYVLPHTNKHFIHHIISFDRSSFYKKIKNYTNQMDLRAKVKGQGGWMVRSYLEDFDDKDWLDIIQNFRVSDERKIVKNVNETMFVKKDIFSHLDVSEIMVIKKNFSLIHSKKMFEANSNEIAYIKNKTFDTDIKLNIKTFKVLSLNNKNTIEINYAK